MLNLLRYAKLIRKKPAVFLRGLKGFLLVNLFKKPAIRGIEIAVTYNCQGKCSKCSCLTLRDEKKREMTKEEILDVCQYAARSGSILVNFTGGEPLLRPDIVEIIGGAASLPLLISLTTNGLLLEDKLIRRLARLNLAVVQLSLSSPYEEEHDREIGIKGSHAKVLEAIVKARGAGIEVLINTVVTKETLYSERLEKLVNIAKKYKSFLSLILPAAVGGWRDEENIMLNIKDYEFLKKKWFGNRYVTIDTESSYKRGVCPAGREKLYVSAYGDVYPCPFIHRSYGNILDDNIYEVRKKMSSFFLSNCINIAKKNY